MYRRVALVFIVLMVMACVPIPASAPGKPEAPAAPPAEQPASALPPAEKPVSWDNLYEKILPELCAPDREPVEQPIFAPPVREPYKGEQITEVSVQHGLFANRQGELFRIDVTGVTQETVQFYTQKVRVCLDQIFTGEVTGGKPSEPGPDQLPDLFGANKDDLSIDVFLVGISTPEGKPEEVIKELIQMPVEKWADWLTELRLTPEQARPEESKQGYVVDFVIDPTANNGGTHHYPERAATKVWVDVSISSGGGSVEAALCRNSSRLDSTTVTKDGAQEPDAMPNDNGGTSTTYDLGVKGNANGTYRVSGRWRWAGWSAAYLDPAPAGSLQNCNPWFQ